MEPPQIEFRGKPAAKDHLQCDDPIQPLIASPKHDPHASARHFVEQIVIAEAALLTLREQTTVVVAGRGVDFRRIGSQCLGLQVDRRGRVAL
jgi:hypothetical protein